jgi:hypothetical protein
MRSDAIVSWSVGGDADGWVARSRRQEVSATSAAELWRAIAAKSNGLLVHLGDKHAEPNQPALAAQAGRIVSGGPDAMIGRVRYVSGRVSRATQRIDAIRYLNTSPGAILVRSEPLAKASEHLAERPFDDFWTFDLANALHRIGWVGATDAQFARTDRCAQDAIVERVPFWRANPRAEPDGNAPLILIYGQIDASASLHFDALPKDLFARLRFLRPGDVFSDLPWLASASLVIVTRGFEQFVLSGSAELLTEIGVPYAWFIDDDFTALRGEEPSFHFYTDERIRAFLGNASALIATTESLADRFAPLAPATIVWPCLYDQDLAKAARTPEAGDFRVGAFGGLFRRDSFKKDVIPAMMALREKMPLAVYAANGLAQGVGAADIAAVPFQPDFRSFVHQWRRMGLHAIVHPYGKSGNIANKSMASLLVAAYLGAVPITGDEPAYSGLGENEGVLKAGRSAQDWLAALRRLSEPAERERLYRRLDRFCRTAFDPERAREPFDALLRLAAPGGAMTAARRIQRACQSQILRRIPAEPVRSRSFPARMKRSVMKRWSRLRNVLVHP